MSGRDPGRERMAAELAATGDYRILRRMGSLEAEPAAPGTRVLQGLALDVETTGFDQGRDRIIQFSAIPFDYSPETGAVHRVGQVWSGFEDPGRPIPAEVVALTGITDEMVKGQRLDDAGVSALAASSALVIAHNAGFDRPFVERRFPAYRDKAWACSVYDVDWKKWAGYPSSALPVLAAWHCEAFYDAHRADEDCLAMLHVLAKPFADGIRPMARLLESARKATIRIYATDAPFDKKDLLKTRRYRWSNGEDGRKKAWWCEVSEDQVEAEYAWLAEQVYGGVRDRWKSEKTTAKERYRAAP